jgi:hypothetical protein
MIRPSDLAHHVTDIVAAATGSQAVWSTRPLMAEEFAKIRIEVWRYFDNVRADMEKEAVESGVRA